MAAYKSYVIRATTSANDKYYFKPNGQNSYEATVGLHGASAWRTRDDAGKFLQEHFKNKGRVEECDSSIDLVFTDVESDTESAPKIVNTLNAMELMAKKIKELESS
jgi:hypothetical protein